MELKSFPEDINEFLKHLETAEEISNKERGYIAQIPLAGPFVLEYYDRFVFSQEKVQYQQYSQTHVLAEIIGFLSSLSKLSQKDFEDFSKFFIIFKNLILETHNLSIVSSALGSWSSARQPLNDHFQQLRHDFEDKYKKSSEFDSSEKPESIFPGFAQIPSQSYPREDLEPKAPYKYLKEESSSYVTSDSPTTEDHLGYGIYSHAIYKFLADEKTKPPLTISIQAPWGGGKTSLMKMIQKELDPDALEQRFEGTKKTESTIPTKDVGITLKDVVGKIKKPNPQGLNFNLQEFNHQKFLSVWFNAWKYEKTEQVWAGLADAIIRQITNRLNPQDRVNFWIEFNRERLLSLDLENSLRNKVQETWMGKIRKWMWAYLTGLGVSIIGGVSGLFGENLLIPSLGAIGSVVWGAIQTSIQRGSAELEVMSQKAENNELIDEYLKIPNYSDKLGFAYSVERDIKTILDVIQISEDNKSQKNSNDQRKELEEIRVVIFIDDLDRCKPEKVAEVIGAINRFISSDVLNCYFIMGMDTEIVAAALEAAHSDIINQIPEYSGRGSVGWRFMDKFVQLPIVIPPPEPGNVELFLEIFAKKEAVSDKKEIVTPTLPKDYSKPSNLVSTYEGKETESKMNLITKVALNNEQSKKKFDISYHSKKNLEKIQNIIKTQHQNFSTNPRDIKRFVNMLRFYYAMCLARQENEPDSLPAPDLEQLSRWLILSLKWPDVARWILRGQTSDMTSNEIEEPDNNSGTKLRLEILQNLGAKTNLSDWTQGLAEEINVKSSSIPWAIDRSLWQFFQKENSRPEDEKLSASAGKGIY